MNMFNVQQENSLGLAFIITALAASAAITFSLVALTYGCNADVVVNLDGREVFKGKALCVDVKSLGTSTELRIRNPKIYCINKLTPKVYAGKVSINTVED